MPDIKELNEKDIENISGGNSYFDDDMALISVGPSITFTNEGTFKCNWGLCDDAIVSNRALKNHFVNKHDFTEEQAMRLIKLIKPELANKQW